MATRLEKSWELIRVCKKIIKEQGPGWQESKENREQQRKFEMEKVERKKRAEIGKEDTLRRITEQKLLKLSAMLPERSRMKIEDEESRKKRILLQETQSNLWKKWRGRIPNRKEYQHMEKEQRLETQLKRVEKELENYKKELENKKEQERREEERRKKYVAEKKFKENERIQKDKEKAAKLKKKKMLEKHWEMLRWLNNFISENKEVWEELEIAKEMEKLEEEKEQKWKGLSEQEKIEDVKKEQSKELKIKLAKAKRASWREWREPEEQIPSPNKTKRKRDQYEGIQPCKPAKKPKESKKAPNPSRGPSGTKTHSGGPDQDHNLGLGIRPVIWTPCETKSAFKTKLAEVKHNKLSEVKEESTRWNKLSDIKDGRGAGGGGGGSGEVSWSGSHAPTSPRAPQNTKRFEMLAGERGGDPSPHVTPVTPQKGQEQYKLTLNLKNPKKNIKILQKEPIGHQKKIIKKKNKKK